MLSPALKVFRIKEDASSLVLEVHVHVHTAHTVINPRRACAARVTVVVLCVCLSVCLSTTILALQATTRLMSDTNSFSATRARKIMWRFRRNDCVREIWRENKLKSQYA